MKIRVIRGKKFLTKFRAIRVFSGSKTPSTKPQNFRVLRAKKMKRNMTKVPKPCKHSPAADLIKDELEHRGFTASAAARAMKIPASRLSQIFTGRKPVSADTAMRFQALTGVSAETIMRIQNAHDFQKAYHASSKSIFQEVKEVATPVS